MALRRLIHTDRKGTNGLSRRRHASVEHAAEPIDLGSVSRIITPHYSKTAAAPAKGASRKVLNELPKANQTSAECAAETDCTGTSQEPFAVSSILLARYNRCWWCEDPVRILSQIRGYAPLDTAT